MSQILQWANRVVWVGFGANPLADFTQNVLEPVAIYLPEPPKHFIEMAAVATILCVAAWRRA
jgi:hypothetical protein